MSTICDSYVRGCSATAMPAVRAKASAVPPRTARRTAPREVSVRRIRNNVLLLCWRNIGRPVRTNTENGHVSCQHVVERSLGFCPLLWKEGTAASSHNDVLD